MGIELTATDPTLGLLLDDDERRLATWDATTSLNVASRRSTEIEVSVAEELPAILDGPGIDGTERLLAVVTTDTLDSEEVTVVMEISLMNDMMNTNDSTDE